MKWRGDHCWPGRHARDLLSILPRVVDVDVVLDCELSTCASYFLLLFRAQSTEMCLGPRVIERLWNIWWSVARTIAIGLLATELSPLNMNNWTNKLTKKTIEQWSIELRTIDQMNNWTSIELNNHLLNRSNLTNLFSCSSLVSPLRRATAFGLVVILSFNPPAWPAPAVCDCIWPGCNTEL